MTHVMHTYFICYLINWNIKSHRLQEACIKIIPVMHKHVRTIFSMDLSTYDSLHSQEFKDVVWGIMEEVGVPNGSDFFPILRHFDLQRVRKRMGCHMNKMLRRFEEIIDKRLRCETSGENDVLDTLLKLVKENELSLDNVKHLLLVRIILPFHLYITRFVWLFSFKLDFSSYKLSLFQSDSVQIASIPFILTMYYSLCSLIFTLHVLGTNINL